MAQDRPPRRTNTLGWILGCWASIVGAIAWVSAARSLEIFTALGVFLLMALALPVIIGRIFATPLARIPFLSIYASPPARRILWYTTVASLLVGFLGSITASKHYWGYWFFRPTISSELTDSQKVLTFASFRANEIPIDSTIRLSMRSDTLVDLLRLHTGSSYDTPWARPAAYLFYQKKLNAQTPLPDASLVGRLETLLNEQQLSFIDTGTKGYEASAANFRGAIIEFLNPRGEKRIYVSLGGGQVSNDHYAYYEMLFAPDNAGNLGPVLDHNKFYYDIAGIEGFEWMILAPFASVFLWLLSLPLILLFAGRSQRPNNPSLNDATVQTA